VPVRRPQKPEQHLRAEEGALIGPGVVTARQQADALGDPRPAIHLIFLAGWHRERLTKVFLWEADQPAVLGPASIKPRHYKASHVLKVNDLDLSHVHTHGAAKAHA